VTDEKRNAEPEWVPVLRELVRTSRHDLRNALNGLVVNLEVVRSRNQDLDASLRQFVLQAVDQAEESVRRAESTILLLNTLVDAIDESGSVRPEVILSIPDDTSGTN
jgi:hypothetical protein